MKYLFMLFLSGILYAQTITFDDQGWNANQLVGTNFTIGYFQFSSNKSLPTNYGYNLDVNNISIYNLFTPGDSISVYTGNLINLQSLAVYQVSQTNTDSLLIEGWNGNSRTYSKIFTNLNKWQILTLNYNNINRFVFKSRNNNTAKNFDYNFDNFVYQELSYTVVVTANPTAGGKVYGGGSYLAGSQVPLHAVPLTNYLFSNWTENGKAVSTMQDPYIISLVKDRNIVGNFMQAAPVELMSFTGSVSRNKVNLIWKTATEINNYGYNIERAGADGVYGKVGFVPGHGNSNIYHTYSFTDIPGPGGYYYYRLKQIDTDGNFTYSKVIYIVIHATIKQLVEK